MFPLYINTQALRDQNGAVAIIPPAGYVACAMSQSVLPSGTVFINLHIFPADGEFRTNMLWVTLPVTAAPLLRRERVDLQTTCQDNWCSVGGIVIFDVQCDDDAPGGPFQLTRSGKRVLYRLGASGAASRVAAQNPLGPPGWACRVGEGYCASEVATGPAVSFGNWPVSVCSKMVVSRRGHRTTSFGRAVDAVTASVARSLAAQPAPGKRRECSDTMRL